MGIVHLASLRRASPDPRCVTRLPRLLIVGLVVVSLFVSSILPGLAQDATPTPGGRRLPARTSSSRYQPNSGARSISALTPTSGTFDPIQPMSNMSLWTVMELYSRLVRVDKLGQDVEGDLAERGMCRTMAPSGPSTCARTPSSPTVIRSPPKTSSTRSSGRWDPTRPTPGSSTASRRSR